MRPAYIQKILLALSIFFVCAGFIAILSPRDGFILSNRYAPSSPVVVSERGIEIYGLLAVATGMALAFSAYRIKR